MNPRLFFRFLFSAAVLIAFLSLEAKADTCTKLAQTIEKTLADAADNLNASEPCEVRESTSADLDADGDLDIVVVFSLEGACGDKEETPGTCGNNFSQYVQVFFAIDKDFQAGPRFTIGGKFSRVAENLHIDHQRIKLDTKKWSPKDPGCCPSKSGALELVLENDALIERHEQ